MFVLVLMVERWLLLIPEATVDEDGTIRKPLLLSSSRDSFIFPVLGCPIEPTKYKFQF